MTRRPLRIALLVLAAAVVLALAWAGWQAWQVNRDLSAATDDARALQDALTEGDDQGTDRALADLQDHARGADERTSGATWGALTRLPVFGDDARGIRLVSGVIADLTDEGIEPLADSAADLESFLPREGQVPLDSLEELQGPVADADEAFAAADRELAEQDSSGFVEPLKVKYRELTEQVSDASRNLSTARTALDLMPTMLGGEGPRDYLLIFQNNAEIRATGGLPGAVALLHAEDGRLTMTRQATGSQFGETPEPVLPLTPAEREIYGEQLGTYFLDANFTPDFPRAAELWKARWEQVYDEEIDGVMALDPVALSYLLEATGPIQAGDLTLTADNAVDELLHQTYIRNPDPAAQDEQFRLVASAVFDTVTSGGQSPRVMLQGLQRAADEHRLYLHSFDEAEREILAGTAVEGALVTDPEADPQVGVFLNDTTGAKMSYFLRYTARVSATSCQGGTQTLSGEAHLESLAPADAATSLPDFVTGGGVFGIPAGAQLVTVRIYGPVGGSIDQVLLNGEPLKDVDAVEQAGRQVMTSHVYLEAQRTSDLSWTMQTGPGQTGDIEVSVTPGITDDPMSALAPSSC